MGLLVEELEASLTKAAIVLDSTALGSPATLAWRKGSGEVHWARVLGPAMSSTGPLATHVLFQVATDMGEAGVAS